MLLEFTVCHRFSIRVPFSKENSRTYIWKARWSAVNNAADSITFVNSCLRNQYYIIIIVWPFFFSRSDIFGCGWQWSAWRTCLRVWNMDACNCEMVLVHAFQWSRWSMVGFELLIKFFRVYLWASFIKNFFSLLSKTSFGLALCVAFVRPFTFFFHASSFKHWFCYCCAVLFYYYWLLSFEVYTSFGRRVS